MKTIIKVIMLISFLPFVSLAEEQKEFKLQMSLDDTFSVTETDEWHVEVQKILTLRFADVRITPKKDYSFDMMLFFKCDTPDLAQFDTPEKMKKSIIASSQQYLPAIVEKTITLQEIHLDHSYGYYTVLTDAAWVAKTDIPDGEFKYMTRGMIRLSPDTALGFSIMTNELDTSPYRSLFDYIFNFVKK